MIEVGSCSSGIAFAATLAAMAAISLLEDSVFTAPVTEFCVARVLMSYRIPRSLSNSKVRRGSDQVPSWAVSWASRCSY